MLEHCQHARFVYNIGLEQRRMWTHAKRSFTAKIGYVSQARELAELRKDLDWLRAGSSVVQQGALRDLDRAFINFFERRARYPQFKRRSEREGSFVVRDVVVHRLNRRTATVLVPKVGSVRFRLTRPWSKVRAASSARVSLRAGQWHVAFTTEPPEKIVAGTGAVVGIDRGVANTIATSDGTFAHAPTPSKREAERLVLLQRRLARQHKGSRRRAGTVKAIARWHLRQSNRRHDWVEKITTDLARTYDVVAIERLMVANMTKHAKPKPDPERPGVYLPNGAAAKSGLNKAILGQCWGQLATRLSAKMPAGAVISVPAAYTSQQCPRCGTTDAANRESQAVFACIECGYTHHADTNAAVNILSRALPGSDTNPRTSGARTRQFLGGNAKGASTAYVSRNLRP